MALALTMLLVGSQYVSIYNNQPCVATRVAYVDGRAGTSNPAAERRDGL